MTVKTNARTNTWHTSERNRLHDSNPLVIVPAESELPAPRPPERLPGTVNGVYSSSQIGSLKRSRSRLDAPESESEKIRSRRWETTGDRNKQSRSCTGGLGLTTTSSGCASSQSHIPSPAQTRGAPSTAGRPLKSWSVCCGTARGSGRPP